jgi:maleamate amidohydrolase
MSVQSWIAQTHSRYVSGGLAGRLDAGRRPAIIVVDLQLGFTDPASPCGTDLDAVVTATRRLLDDARELGLPVLFTVIAFTQQQRDELVWMRKMPAMSGLLHKERVTELDPRLGRREHEPVLVKQAPSAFSGTGIEAHLCDANVDSLIVCGATTSGCVRATTIDACTANWPTFVPRECVGDRERGPHDANLLDIDAKYADVIDLARARSMLAEVVSA